jgi:hypothetical protein
MERGTSQNVSELPDEFESKEAFLALQREFAGGTSDPVRILVDGSASSPEVQAGIAALQEGLAETGDFAPNVVVTPSPNGSVVLVET